MLNYDPKSLLVSSPGPVETMERFLRDGSNWSMKSTRIRLGNFHLNYPGERVRLSKKCRSDGQLELNIVSSK
jgi:hypothetical protein